MTNVQTVLEPDELKEFEDVCKKEHISKRKAMKIAIMNWIREKKGLDPGDALFTMPAGSATIERGARHVDEVVYKTRD
ncbi:MAG: hypothetical protein Q6373_014450 [Candidatus Sigynarchaeota archaeon]